MELVLFLGKEETDMLEELVWQVEKGFEKRFSSKRGTQLKADPPKDVEYVIIDRPV